MNFWRMGWPTATFLTGGVAAAVFLLTSNGDRFGGVIERKLSEFMREETDTGRVADANRKVVERRLRDM